MKQYHELLELILREGVKKEDRTGTGTLSVFGHQSRYNLSEGFPMVTTKKVPFRLIVHELLWFLQGSTNIQYLVKNNVHIWDDWPYNAFKKSEAFAGETMEEFSIRMAADDSFAAQWGELGPVYGYQWRSWPSPDGSKIDQIQQVVDMLNRNPDSRRILVSAWNVSFIDQMSLPPCHTFFQFYVAEGRLSCQLYQRSADVFLGVPFNIASYALLTMMMAQVCGFKPGEFIHTFGDAHIYRNHLDQVKLQLSRELRPLPELIINPSVNSIFEFTINDLDLANYNPHPVIKAEVAV